MKTEKRDMQKRDLCKQEKATPSQSFVTQKISHELNIIEKRKML